MDGGVILPPGGDIILTYELFILIYYVCLDVIDNELLVDKEMSGHMGIDGAETGLYILSPEDLNLDVAQWRID